VKLIALLHILIYFLTLNIAIYVTASLVTSPREGVQLMINTTIDFWKIYKIIVTLTPNPSPLFISRESREHVYNLNHLTVETQWK
jgi:hypothetical protein